LRASPNLRPGSTPHRSGGVQPGALLTRGQDLFFAPDRPGSIGALRGHDNSPLPRRARLPETSPLSVALQANCLTANKRCERLEWRSIPASQPKGYECTFIAQKWSLTLCAWSETPETAQGHMLALLVRLTAVALDRESVDAETRALSPCWNKCLSFGRRALLCGSSVGTRSVRTR